MAGSEGLRGVRCGGIRAGWEDGAEGFEIAGECRVGAGWKAWGKAMQRRGAGRCLMEERLLPLWALRGAGLFP